MSIPFDTGYSLADGQLHTRYPAHPTVDDPRRCRTVRAVLALAPDPVPCDICYPPPPQEVKRESRKAVSRPSTRRRVSDGQPDDREPMPELRSRAQEDTGAPPPPPDPDTAGLRTYPPAPSSEEDQA